MHFGVGILVDGLRVQHDLPDIHRGLRLHALIQQVVRLYWNGILVGHFKPFNRLLRVVRVCGAGRQTDQREVETAGGLTIPFILGVPMEPLTGRLGERRVHVPPIVSPTGLIRNGSTAFDAFVFPIVVDTVNRVI